MRYPTMDGNDEHGHEVQLFHCSPGMGYNFRLGNKEQALIRVVNSYLKIEKT
jgi:hypothetical protein